MTSFDIDLSETEWHFVRQRVQNGSFESAEAYIIDLIQRDHQEAERGQEVIEECYSAS